jgi:hypothetical protein
MVNQNDINCPVAAVVKTAMVTPEIAALHPPREKGRSTTMLGHSATCLVGKSGTLVGAQHGAAFVLSEGTPFSSLFCSSSMSFLLQLFRWQGHIPSPFQTQCGWHSGWIFVANLFWTANFQKSAWLNNQP